MLPCSTFLELCDVVPSLPPYREEIYEAEMGDPLASAYEAFERETIREIGRMLACGDKYRAGNGNHYSYLGDYWARPLGGVAR